jgi:hypothetical protein
MATTSEVTVGLDKIAETISQARSTVLKAKTNTEGAVALLNAIPTEFADVLSTINDYGTEDAYEAVAKAKLAKLTSEFVALVTAGTVIIETEV